MPAPDPFASLTPGMNAPTPTLPGRNERKRTGYIAVWKLWVWPLLGVIGGVTLAVAVRLPLAELPLVDVVTYAQDNMARASALTGCAVLAAVCSLAWWFRLALLAQGMAAGLLLASGLEKWREYQQVVQGTRVAPGAGEMAQQFAAMSAKTLASIHPKIAAFLLPAGCLLGIAAALAGGWAAARRAKGV